MTRFFKKTTLYSVGAVVSALILFCSACTEVNDQLGVNIVPPGEQMEVKFATLQEGISNYLSYTDSIRCNGFDYAYFGKLRSEGLGNTTAAALDCDPNVCAGKHGSIVDSVADVCDESL